MLADNDISKGKPQAESLTKSQQPVVQGFPANTGMNWQAAAAAAQSVATDSQSKPLSEPFAQNSNSVQSPQQQQQPPHPQPTGEQFTRRVEDEKFPNIHVEEGIDDFTVFSTV